jgi:hypothetical protein
MSGTNTGAALRKKLGFEWRQAVRSILWSGEGQNTPARTLGWGAAVWGGYTVLYLCIRGIHLDQDVIPAQFIAGAIRNPPGHPHQIFYPTVFNLPNYSGALLWKLVSGPWLLSLVRNFVFLFLNAYGAFSAATVLTGVPMWGHIAAVFTLSETATQFEGRYPLRVFPMFYSDGHIGLAFAVLLAVLLTAGCWRTGGFLYGLLPSIHASMAVVLWPWGLGFALLQRRQFSQVGRRAVIAAVGGIVLCLLLAVFLRIHGPPAAGLPYQEAANGEQIHRAFMDRTEYHRSMPNLRSPAYLIGPVAFFGFCGLVLWKDSRRHLQEARFSIAGLGLICWAYCFASVIYRLAGGRLSEFITMSMPNRFSNIPVFLLLPLTVAVMARAWESMDTSGKTSANVLLIGLLVIQALGLPSARSPLSRLLIFAVWGVAIAMTVSTFHEDAKRRFAAIGIAAGIGVSLITVVRLPYKAVVITVFAVSLIGSILLLIAARRSALRMPFGGVPLACAVVLASLCSIPGPELRYATEAWGRITPFEQELGQWLQLHSGPDEMILPPLLPRTELQAKVNRPVLMESETLPLMTYMPKLSAPIGMMAWDLYGLDYTNPVRLATVLNGREFNLEKLDQIWIERKLEEWQALGRKYKFRFVVSRAPLRLPAALSRRPWSLYVIP